MVTCILILQETEDPASDDDSGHTDSEGGVDSMDIVSRKSTCILANSSSTALYMVRIECGLEPHTIACRV